MNIFRYVKDAVSVKDAASFYNVKVYRNGMCVCPFHSDKNPSMKVDARFHCFGCGADGDVINFVEKLFNLSPISAAKKICNDFGLPSPLINSSKHSVPYKLSAAEISRQIEIILKKAIDDYIKQSINILLIYSDLLHFWIQNYSPKTSEELTDCHPLYQQAIHHIDKTEWLLDELMTSKKSEQFQLLKYYGKEIKDIEQRLNEYNTGGTN